MVLPVLLAFGVSCVTLDARPSEEFPGAGRTWRYFRSPNFEMYSSTDRSASRDALERLELLRAVVLEKLHFKARKPRPVTVYYFNSGREFRRYLPEKYQGNDSYVGFCNEGYDRTVITMMQAGDDDEAREIVYHEYIHYVVQIAELEPPPWFDEGLAELYSTMKDTPLGIEIGRPSRGRMEELRHASLLPLDVLFGATRNSELFTRDDHTGVFYAESWAVLHFCQCGVKRIPPEQLERFYRTAADRNIQAHPEVLRAACRDLFGCDYAELLKRIQAHLLSGSYRWSLSSRPRIADSRTYTERAASGEEMVERLAELDFRVNRSPRGRLGLLQALDRAPASARPHEALGNDAVVDGDTRLARDEWEKAVALGTDNPAVYQQLGRIEGSRWFDEFDFHFRLPDEKAEYLRGLLRRSIEWAPDQSEAFETLAWVEGTARVINADNVERVTAHLATLNHQPRTLLALAMVAVHQGSPDRARSLLAQIRRSDPDRFVKSAADVIEGELDGRRAPRMRLSEEPAGPLQIDPLPLPDPGH